MKTEETAAEIIVVSFIHHFGISEHAYWNIIVQEASVRYVKEKVKDE